MSIINVSIAPFFLFGKIVQTDKKTGQTLPQRPYVYSRNSLCMSSVKQQEKTKNDEKNVSALLKMKT